MNTDVPAYSDTAYSDTAYSDTPLTVTLIWAGSKSFINRVSLYPHIYIWFL